MNQSSREYCSSISTNESLTTVGSIDCREGIHPSIFLTKINKEKIERPLCPAPTRESKALHWALTDLLQLLKNSSAILDRWVP
jgi:hypothetical protein